MEGAGKESVPGSAAGLWRNLRKERIDTAIRDMGQGIYLPLKERIWLRGSLYDSFRRLDILQELVDDKTVSEIMVNGAGKIFIERNGKTQAWERRFEKPEHHPADCRPG